MAVADAPLALPSGAPSHDGKVLGVFTRAQRTTGWRSWITGVDHKKVGIMYGAAAIFFLLIGGFEALLIRMQLWAPRQQLLSADVYNQVYTMHGTTMVFLVVMPIGAAFANYLLPLQIGARDVAFPRLNAFSFWCFLFGGIFLNTSWLLGGGADGGWFMYAPNNGVLYSPSHGIDFWVLGLIITGIASMVSSVNLIVTVLNMRAPGMSMMKMPIFTWMTLVTQFLLLFALPVITVAPNNDLLEKLKSNLMEVRARGGELFVFADPDSGFESSDGVTVINMPRHVTYLQAPAVYTIPMQLLAYHVAILRGTDVDQPRNLAKSVTVE